MPKLQIGTGATCSCLIRLLHHRKTVRTAYPNATKQERLNDLLVIGQEKKIINSRIVLCVVMRHDQFPNESLYAARNYVAVEKEGHPSQFFGELEETSSFLPPKAAGIVTGTQEDSQVQFSEPLEIPGKSPSSNPTDPPASSSSSSTTQINIVTPPKNKKKPSPIVLTDDGPEKLGMFLHTNMGNNAEDIGLVKAGGFDVDDDNQCLPENEPESEADMKKRSKNSDDALKENKQQWGWNGIDERQCMNGFNVKAKMKDLPREVQDLKHISHYGMFMRLLPIYFLVTIVEATSNRLVKSNLSPTNRGEFLRFIGIWFFMSTVGTNVDRRAYWSSLNVSEQFGAPYRFHHWMSRTRFEEIHANLEYTTKKAPSYADRFWQIRDMVRAWNRHMAEVFRASWVSCLDESMSIWFNRFTCPGWVFCLEAPSIWK